MYTYPTGRTAAQVYDDLHSNDNHYGDTNHGGGSEHLCEGFKSLLDVGAGCSKYAMEAAPKSLMRTAICDISQVAVDIQNERGVEAQVADLSEGLPYEDSSFEVVTCFDVLEHIQPEKAVFAMKELLRVAKHRIILTIASFACKGREEQLHLTVEPLGWWIEMLLSLSKCTVDMAVLARPEGHTKRGNFKVLVIDL